MHQLVCPSSGEQVWNSLQYFLGYISWGKDYEHKQ
jgi:hypothetical protein